MSRWGTYEGHRILSDAMDSTLNRQLEADKLKSYKKKVEGEVALNQIKIDEYREAEARRMEKERQIRMNETSRLALGPITSFDPEGNLVVNNGVLDSYNKTFDMANILTGDQNNVLTKADRDEILNSATSIGTDDILNLKKQFIKSGMSEEDIESFLKNNPNLKQSMDIHKLQTNDPLYAGKSHAEVLAGTEDSDPILSMSKGFGAEDHVELSQHMQDWGGGIEFKGLAGANSTDNDQLNILHQALIAGKNAETGTDESDTIWIDQNPGGGWTVTENDAFGNDVYDVFVKDGKAYIKFEGEDKLLNEMKSSDWD